MAHIEHYFTVDSCYLQIPYCRFIYLLKCICKINTYDAFANMPRSKNLSHPTHTFPVGIH